MLRKALAAVLERTADHFETELTLSDLTTWARAACIEAMTAAGAAEEPNDLTVDVSFAAKNAVALFPEVGFDGALFRIVSPNGEQLDRARSWSANLAKQPKFPADPLPTGLGPSLEYLYKDMRESSTAEERLLRHVELRHEECLLEWDGAPTGNARDHERLGIAILLTSTSRRTGDLRFLNGALKMVDWFAARHIRSRRRTPQRFHHRVLRTVTGCLASLEAIER